MAISFEEWYDKEFPKGAEPLVEYDVEYDDGEYNISHVMEYSLKDLMQKAWEARYNTLTYHDL